MADERLLPDRPVHPPNLAPSEPADEVTHATMSALIPGLGQWQQGRRLIGALQLATVLGYVAAAVVTESGRAAWLALAWNVWSSVDAFRYARRERLEDHGHDRPSERADLIVGAMPRGTIRAPGAPTARHGTTGEPGARIS
jgi:hypothetical protein